jgi:hypothetical protein
MDEVKIKMAKYLNQTHCEKESGKVVRSFGKHRL